MVIPSVRVSPFLLYFPFILFKIPGLLCICTQHANKFPERSVYTVLWSVQKVGRLYLRRDGVGVPRRSGLGVCTAHCRLVVRHDGLWSRLPQTLQVPGSCKPEAHGIPRKRYCILHKCSVYCVLHVVLSRNRTSSITMSTNKASSSTDCQEFRGTLRARIFITVNLIRSLCVLEILIHNTKHPC